MTTKTIALCTIRKIANKYNLTWHIQGWGWAINGVSQHYSYGRDNAGEKAALANYMANWGESVMSEDDFATVCAAQAQIQA